MKKSIVCILICILFALTLPLTTFAMELVDGKLTVNGDIRAWATSVKNRDFNSDSANDDDMSWFAQKFRLYTIYTVNDNVSVHFRMDYTDGVWGNDFDNWNEGWADADEDAELEVDRAFMLFKKGNITAAVGQHWNGAGPNYILWDQQSTGITLDFALPVNVKLSYSKIDEGSAWTDSDNITVDLDGDGIPESGSEDVDFLGLSLNYNIGNSALYATFAMREDHSDADLSPWGIGIAGTTKLGKLSLNLEIDHFGGNHGELDVVGTQCFADIGLTINDQLTGGLIGVFATGTDDTENEIQYNSVSAGAWSFDPFDWEGAMRWNYPPLLFGAKGQFDMLAQLANPVPGLDLVNGYDPDSPWGGNSTGSRGICPYVRYRPNADWFVYGKVIYQEPNQEENTVIDSLLGLTAGMDYTFFNNSTTFSLGLMCVKPEFENNLNDDTLITAMSQIQVKF